MRAILLTRVLFFTASMMMVLSMPISASEPEDKRLYLKRLKYEFNNRMFAYLSMKKAAHVLKNVPEGVFYQAYY